MEIFLYFTCQNGISNDPSHTALSAHFLPRNPNKVGVVIPAQHKETATPNPPVVLAFINSSVRPVETASEPGLRAASGPQGTQEAPLRESSVSIDTTVMAGLFDRQAEVYADARPTYPPEWYARLAELTSRHDRAWDAGTGNGQAAISVAEHYDQVIATDASDAQLSLATPHPKVTYMKTPPSISEDDLVALVGGEGSIDLITVAQAVHWFDLPTFYAAASRALRKPGGVIAVWCYNDATVNPAFDDVFRRFHATTMPYWDRNIQPVFDGYRSLPFPFDPVGYGCEGTPVAMEMRKDTSFDGFMGLLRSWSAVVTAKEKGVGLLSDEVVEEMAKAWGGADAVREVTYQVFMLAGTPKIESGNHGEYRSRG